ncbi:sigma-70 family RNA polymerase sigma factor [Candidatus Gracilibacteria bacterium]|nr:sigma-70 family RNA polymerase sigma factor [Candidatus Gracilibacteria bacterium]MCF7856176.1 sigma-70 family RNA polymerase sigma factor [Candidatus Gracilibacteria bacterium]MCF7896448.1 sigma-70 family RNA polymerase sigma factor [Candidatus Gracilibacteria bacterium]
MALSKKELREIESLIRKSKKGDAEAFGQIYDKFVLPIYRYIYYRVSKSQAEDLTELVFLRAWEKLASYSKQAGGNFNSWIFRIAHNAVIDSYRENSKADLCELTEEIPEVRLAADPVQNLENKFEQVELIRALRQLPDLQQQVVVLKFVNGFENSEIAAVIGKSVGAVRVIQFRALNRLKDLLKQTEAASNKAAKAAFKTVEDAGFSTPLFEFSQTLG